MPLPAASASAVKNPATPFRMVMNGSPFNVPSNRKRKSQASPCCDELVDVDVVDDRFADPRQPAMERHHGVEQPINRQAAGSEVDAEEAGEEEVGLPALDGDRGRDAAGFEIPAVRADGVLGDDAAARHRLRLALDERDAIDQLQRAIGQPNAGGEAVDLREQRPEHVDRLARPRTRQHCSYVRARGGGIRLTLSTMGGISQFTAQVGKRNAMP